jgi:hypothetical protein
VQQLARNKKDDNINGEMITSHVALWFPNVKHWMMPLSIIGLVLNIVAFIFSGNFLWFLCIGCYVTSAILTYFNMKSLFKDLTTATGENLSANLAGLAKFNTLRISLSMIAAIASNMAMFSLLGGASGN